MEYDCVRNSSHGAKVPYHKSNSNLSRNMFKNINADFCIKCKNRETRNTFSSELVPKQKISRHAGETPPTHPPTQYNIFTRQYIVGISVSFVMNQPPATWACCVLPCSKPLESEFLKRKKNHLTHFVIICNLASVLEY